MGTNRQSDEHAEDKPEGKPSDHGGLPPQPRPDGPDDNDAPDPVVIEKTLPRIPIGPKDV